MIAQKLILAAILLCRVFHSHCFPFEWCADILDDKILVNHKSADLYVIDLAHHSFISLHLRDLTLCALQGYPTVRACCAGSQYTITCHTQTGGSFHEAYLTDDLTDIALDFVNNNLYILQRIFLSVLSLKNQGQQAYLYHSKYYNKLAKIAIDPFENYRYLFWLEQSNRTPCIMRSLLDGSEITNIVSTNINRPAAIALDILRKIVFWIEAFDVSVHMMDYNGNHRTKLLHMKYIPISFQVDTKNHRLILTEFKKLRTLDYKRCQTNCTLTKVCKLYDFQVKDVQTIYQFPKETNACDHSNCKHICIPTTGNNSTCKEGFEVTADLKFKLPNGTKYNSVDYFSSLQLNEYLTPKNNERKDTVEPLVLINSLNPSSGPESGNTTITLLGENLNASLILSIIINNQPLCTHINRTTFGITCVTLPNRSPLLLNRKEHIELEYGHFRSFTGVTYMYTNDPKIFAITPMATTVNGNILITVYGNNFDVVSQATFITTVIFKLDLDTKTYYEDCQITSKHQLICSTPNLSDRISKDSLSNVIINIGIKLDQMNSYNHLSTSLPGYSVLNLFPDPTFNTNNQQTYHINKWKNKLARLEIPGKNFNMGILNVYYQILIGESNCTDINVQKKVISCLPPDKSKISFTNVTVIFGKLKFSAGRIIFVDTFWNCLICRVSTISAVVLVAIVLVAVLVKYKNIIISKVLQRVNIDFIDQQLNNVEGINSEIIQGQ